MAFVLSVLGVVLIIEGIPYFAFPAKVKRWALSIQEVPEGRLRLLGFISMSAGLMILYILRISG